MTDRTTIITDEKQALAACREAVRLGLRFSCERVASGWKFTVVEEKKRG